MLKLVSHTDRPRLRLVSEFIDYLGARADEGQARLFDLAREFCILREEPVSVKPRKKLGST